MTHFLRLQNPCIMKKMIPLSVLAMSLLYLLNTPVPMKTLQKATDADEYYHIKQRQAERQQILEQDLPEKPPVAVKVFNIDKRLADNSINTH